MTQLTTTSFFLVCPWVAAVSPSRVVWLCSDTSFEVVLWYVNVSTRRSRGKSYECAAVDLPYFLSSAALNVLLIQDPLFKTTGAREVV